MRRRDVVKLGIVAVGCLGCGGGDGDPPVDALDSTGFEMCGANVCLNLADPANAALANVNGARSLNIPDKIIIVRTSATTFAVLSRVCTHAMCGIAYQPSPMEFACPCHGSRFALDGSVVRGPASRSLKKYASTFDEVSQTLTITLA